MEVEWSPWTRRGRTWKAKLNLSLVGYWGENGYVRLDPQHTAKVAVVVAHRSVSKRPYSNVGNVTELIYARNVDRNV